MDLSSVILMTVVAGYGDPVNGFPSATERQLVLWTNAARVDPTAFSSEYSAGGCSTADFSDDEKTAKPPLYLDLDLTEVARVHSEDMHDNGCFQHESCDGTDTWTRVGSYYHDENSGLGENIAEGSGDPRDTVLSMWMCSHAGHRANIMSGDFNEMGGGVAAALMTQDFAAGELNDGTPPVRVAAEDRGAVWADWGNGAPPSSLVLEVGAVQEELSLEYGTGKNGLYGAKLDASDCTPWRVAWETSAGATGTFPATGAFLSGACGNEYDVGATFGGGDDGGELPDGTADDTDGVVKLPHLMCGAETGVASALSASAALLLLAARRRR